MQPCEPNKLFLTGPPGVGKSTIMRKAVDYAIKKGIKTTGFFTPDIRDNSYKRVGFDIEVLNYGNVPLARKNAEWNLRFGDYYINPEAKQAFQMVLRDIDFEKKDRKLIVIDEIGPMELMLEGSKEFFILILQQNVVPVIGVFHRKLSLTHPDLYRLIKKNIVYELSIQNREAVLMNIMKWIDSCYY